MSLEITDRDEIARFYDYYSKLKNSSDKYFEKLFGTAGNDSGPIDVEIDPAHPNAKGQSQVDPIAPDAPVSTSAGEVIMLRLPTTRDTQKTCRWRSRKMTIMRTIRIGDNKEKSKCLPEILRRQGRSHAGRQRNVRYGRYGAN